MESQKGKVWLAGGGPGDAEFMTIKTKKLIESADVIVYDALISTEIMSLIRTTKSASTSENAPATMLSRRRRSTRSS